MFLRPLQRTDADTVAAWLGREENYRWLDFGSGQQVLHSASIALMAQRDLHCLRLLAEKEDGTPIGIVAISNIAREFKSGTLWFVLGDKSFSGKGCMTRAVGMMLDLAFEELGLESVNAWVVEDNAPSLRVVEKSGFRRIGIQRRCHLLDGRLRDRILFDILATEHRAR